MKTFITCLIALPMMAQNYTGFPVVTLSTSAATVTSGGSATLTYAATCPTSTCTYQMDHGLSATTGSGTVSTGALTHTTTFTYLTNNATVGIFIATVTVFVGPGTTTGIIESIAPQDYGPGVPITSPQYKMVEVTYTDAGAGCLTYVPNITGCSGGSVSNPWEDVQGWATFTGETSHTTYRVGLFYLGGYNASTHGNAWKFRFAPPTAEVWDYTATVGDPNDYKTFSHTALFTSINDPNIRGPLSVYSAGSYLLKTADGNVFYPIGINMALSDLGNGGTTGQPWSGDIGENPSPITGGSINSQAAVGTAMDQAVKAGINFFVTNPVSPGLAQNIWTSNLGSAGTNEYLTGGVGFLNGFTSINAALPFDYICRLAQQFNVHLMLTPEAQPTSTYAGFGSLSVFTSNSDTQAWLHGWQYYINRWGACADVWNLANEKTANAAFLATTDLWIKQQDPYEHLITMVNPLSDQNNDLNTPHSYAVNANSSTAANTASTILGDQSSIPNKPVIMTEWGADSVEAPPIHWFERASSWAAFFSRGYLAIYPSSICNGTSSPGGPTPLCTPEFVQLSILSSFISTFDPTATSISATFSISGAGQTVNAYGLGSNNDVGFYVVNTTGTGTVAGTMTWTVPSASMACLWINPLTGATISSFTTSGTLGSQTFTLPTFSVVSGASEDVLLRCRSLASPVVTTSTLPAGLISTSYGSVTIAAYGGAGGPFTWSVSSGALPHGMTLNASTGVISGTPDMAGFWWVGIKATDSGATASVEQRFIIPVLPAISIGRTSLDNIVVSVNPFGGQTLPVFGGAQPVSCSWTGTPVAGITIAANCSLTGTPTASGTMSLSVTATDASSNIASGTVTLISLAGGAPALTSASLPQATLGNAYSTIMAAKPVTGTETWAVSSGSLPAGLTLLASSNGDTEITGIPTAIGSTTFSIQVTDSTTGAGVAQSFTIVVNNPPVITTLPLNSYVPGKQFYQTIVTSGGSLPNWCEVTGGALPPGFYLDANGCNIYGTAGPGNYVFTITSWDTNHAGASIAYNMGIRNNPASAFLLLP